ncbi:MAG: efflux RND transporter periplasmic adaptor subunit [Planctomycetes bacterium]|nr:efflux RND transporter periplasmic adaptor subunit [Planctomycetota bacterium]
MTTELAVAKARSAAKAAELEEARVGTRAEDLAIARARVDQAQARLAEARRGLQETRLVALTDGVVLRRLASVGDHVTVGTAVLEVVDLGDLEVEIEIPGRYAYELGDAPRVLLTADDLPGWSYETALSARIPAADERSRNYTGVVRLERGGAGAALRPGMFVRAEVDLRLREDVLVVPADAVRRTPLGTEIAKAVVGEAQGEGPPPTTAEVLAVDVLASYGGQSAVALKDPAASLAAGERVVLSGVDRVFPGAPLLPAQAAPAP